MSIVRVTYGFIIYKGRFNFGRLWINVVIFCFMVKIGNFIWLFLLFIFIFFLLIGLDYLEVSDVFF